MLDISISEFGQLAIPRAACDIWDYLPVQLTDKIAPGHYWSVMPQAELFQFGIMSSSMHMAWIKCVSGKLACYDRANYNPTIKSFPWPIAHTQKQILAIEAQARTILRIRAQYPAMTLEELYHPYTMPAALYDAHIALDAAVDQAYGRTQFDNSYSRIGFLLNLHTQLACLLDTNTPTGRDIDALEDMLYDRRSMASYANTWF